jgi:hypothetical protein
MSLRSSEGAWLTLPVTGDVEDSNDLFFSADRFHEERPNHQSKAAPIPEPARTGLGPRFSNTV